MATATNQPTFDGLLNRTRCWHCLCHKLERRTSAVDLNASLAGGSMVSIRILCAHCGASREFAVPATFGQVGIDTVERQWFWIICQRTRLVCLLMALVVARG